MNRTWVRDRLAEFGELLAQARIASLPGSAKEVPYAEMHRRADTLSKIFERLGFSPEVKFDFSGTRDILKDRIDFAIGVVDDMEEVAENLGWTAPVLSAAALHPWVWDAARTFWDSQHYQSAVEAGAKSVNAHTQTKVGRRDLSDNDLMNHVFSEKRKPGQRYLFIPGDSSDLTVKSRNQALRPFAQGCFAGIRNLAAHEHDNDWPEQQALEYLAALSILARWIDECEIQEGPAEDDRP